MKYLLKNTTRKTVWKKILGKPNITTKKIVTVSLKTDPVKINGIKLCTWSRDFDWEPFTLNQDSINK